MAGNHLINTLRASSRDRPEMVFARLPDGREVSYGSFFSGAERTAAALIEAGMQPGDRVAAQVKKTIEALQLYLGTVMAGGIFLPLNTGYRSSELEHFVTDAEPSVFVCDPSSREEVMALGPQEVLTLDAKGSGTLTDSVASQSAGYEPVDRQTDDLAAILYTSGTTGKPKGAMLSHGNLTSNAVTLTDCWDFSRSDVLIHALPIFHTHGLFVATNVALVSGCSLIFHAGFDAEAVVAAMPDATALMGVPTFYTRLLAADGVAKASRNMRLFVSGSAPLLAETHIAWEKLTGHKILERYGMTETNMNTSNPLEGERRAGTVGFPLPGVEIRLTDGKGRLVEHGEPGIIEVRGPNVFKGYWNLPEKTAEELLPDGFFVTGDIAEIDEDGYVQIVGRAKDMIISGGYNVYPKEIEILIDAIPGVLESAVIGIAHPDFGEGVVAVVVPESGGSISAELILDTIAPDLASYKRPKHVAIVESLPRNTMGKVQKAQLRQSYDGLFT